MNLGAEEEPAPVIHLPADIDWQMLNKFKFFFVGAALFFGVSAIHYPIVVLKTRQQIAHAHLSSVKIVVNILQNEGFRGLYRGFGTSLIGTIPARALYVIALEVTKSNIGTVTIRLGLPKPMVATIANASAGVSTILAAQLVSMYEIKGKNPTLQSLRYFDLK